MFATSGKRLMPSAITAYLDCCCVTKNYAKIRKGTLCSRESSEMNIFNAKRNDCPAKHQRCHSSCNWVSNRGSNMIFSNGNYQLTFVAQIPSAAEGQRDLDVRRHFGQIHFAVVRLEDFLHPRAGGVNALVLLPETAQRLMRKPPEPQAVSATRISKSCAMSGSARLKSHCWLPTAAQISSTVLPASEWTRESAMGPVMPAGV